MYKNKLNKILTLKVNDRELQQYSKQELYDLINTQKYCSNRRVLTEGCLLRIQNLKRARTIYAETGVKALIKVELLEKLAEFLLPFPLTTKQLYPQAVDFRKTHQMKNNCKLIVE